MYSLFSTTIHRVSRQNFSRIKSHQRLISSATLTRVFYKAGADHLGLKKENQNVNKTPKESFSTGRKWNPFYVRKSSYNRILEVEGNKHCPDCSSPDVHYISTINGGLYCPVCAGIHRELGIHPDFLPLSNDIKISNEDMQFYESMGNYNVNNIYEAALDITGTNKPTIASPRCEVTDYIQKKYMDCSFSISRYDRPSTENVLHFVSNMRLKGNQIPNLREKINERAGTTYDEVMNEAFNSPYVLQVAE